MFTRIVLPLFAYGFAAAAIAASPAAAKSAAADQKSIEVAIGDLDLTKDAGKAALDRRLHIAVRKICSATSGRRTLADQLRYRECVDTAQASYQDQVRIAINNANARRVAVLADKLGMLAGF